jgi:hypothetical protein
MAPFFDWLDIVKDLEAGPTLPLGMSRRGIVLGEVMLALRAGKAEAGSAPAGSGT